MGVKGIWKSNMVTLVLLIFLNFLAFSFGTTAWIIIGVLLLAGAMYFSFRQGMGIGREACAILKTVSHAMDPESAQHESLDKKYISQTWSVARGVKSIFASALIPYVAGCVYIICTLLKVEPMILPSRVIAWVLALPYWPIITYWYQEFTRLEPAIVAILMISPFVLPLCTFAGYLQGPKLWKKTEEAMAQGKRRAKAKSRIVKKKQPKVQKPQI